MRTTLGLAALVAVAALLPVTAAEASSICTENAEYGCGGTLQYRAAPGEVNAVTVSNTATSATVTDSGATISQTNGSGCEISADGHTAVCPLPVATTGQTLGFEFFSFLLGDGNDSIVNNLNGGSQINFFSVSISLAAGNDSATGSDSINTSDQVRGGTGDDSATLRAGSDGYGDFDGNETGVPAGQFPMGGNNTIDLGAGDDGAAGGPGVDTIQGGPDDDEIRGDTFASTSDDNEFRASRAVTVSNTTGNDVIDGGDGFDRIVYSLPPVFDANGKPVDPTATTPGAKVTLPDAGATTTGNGIGSESDTLKSVEDVDGTPGADTLTGSNVSNIIHADSGNDAIDGAGGPDTLFGENDDDTINAADGVSDRVICGGQAGDKATIDQFDATGGCPAPGAGTTVNQVTNTTPGPTVDKSPPVLVNVRTPRSIKAKTLKKKGYKFSLGTKDTTSVRLLATMTAKVGNKLAISSTAGEVILAEKRKTFKTKVTMTLKIAKKLKKAIKKRKKLRLLIQVSDQAGNTTPRRVVIKIT